MKVHFEDRIKEWIELPNTRLLSICKGSIQLNDEQHIREVWLGNPLDADVPYPVVVMTVWPESLPMLPDDAYWVDFIETMEPCRRNGYATDLWRAAERHYGKRLMGSAISDSGNALTTSLEARFPKPDADSPTLHASRDTSDAPAREVPV